MRTINVMPGQTIIDIATQEYGNIEAVSELLELNNLNNITFTDALQCERLVMNEDSDLLKKNVIRDLEQRTIISE